MATLFDSSIYIRALRDSDTTLLVRRWGREAPLWLSAVVLEELYAGAARGDWRIVEKLERDFDRAKRILVPSLADWSMAGRVLARVAEKYGFEKIGRARLTNDALIAASAARAGITVLTLNERDFARLAEFCPVQWQVRTVAAS